MRSPAEPSQALPPIRRVVTGHDTSGRAVVIADGPAASARTPFPGFRSTLLWSSDRSPIPLPLGTDVEDMGARTLGIQPPPNGSRFVVNDIAPGGSPLHRTETIDYAIVIAGEIDCDLDASSVTLRAGDVLVQRGTNHAWMNRGTAPARVAFVLIDAEPPEVSP